jgi:hypothetical protein
VGSVSARASKYSWLNEGGDFSGFQHSQNRCGAAKEVEPAVVGGDLLIGTGTGTEKVTQLVVGPAEFASRSWALEPAHRTVAALVDVMFSEHRDMAAAKAFFESAKMVTGVTPDEVTTDGHDSLRQRKRR